MIKPRITPKPGDWAARFALKRRSIDRKLLAEWERNYGDMPPEASTLPHEATYQTELETARAAIARAFGRPLR